FESARSSRVVRIKVWDLPLRLFHWALAVAVTGALVTINLGAAWIEWHGRFGLTVVGLIAFRLAWGVLGSTHSRFCSFFPTPAALGAYLRGNWQRPGHNPLGALSVLDRKSTRLNSSHVKISYAVF